MPSSSYVIVTPARNEEANIGRTLESMVAQTLLPDLWVIVDDGSTDGTGAIVKAFAQRHDFIVHVSAEYEGKASFGSKVNAFQAGFAETEDLDYAYIGNLDADVSFEPDYFESLISKMEEMKHIGLAGGIILEQIDHEFVPQRISTDSVAGAVQLFRRSCYQDIGGYRPIEIGGIDSMVEIMARMRGWDVCTFRDLPVRHHGRVTAGARSVFGARFKKGRINYALGYHPLFQVCVGVSRMTQAPYILGGFLIIAGYALAAIRREKHSMPPESVKYLRGEQLKRLRLSLTRRRQTNGFQ